MGNGPNKTSRVGNIALRLGGAGASPLPGITIDIATDPWAVGTWVLHPTLLELVARFEPYIDEITLTPVMPADLSQEHVSLDRCERASLTEPAVHMANQMTATAVPSSNVVATRALETVMSVAPDRGFTYLYHLQAAVYQASLDIESPEYLVRVAEMCGINSDIFVNYFISIPAKQIARFDALPRVTVSLESHSTSKTGVISSSIETTLLDWGLEASEPEYQTQQLYSPQVADRIITIAFADQSTEQTATGADKS